MLRLAEGAICGAAAGVVTGVAARVAMRRVADGLPDTMSRLPSFTLEGTTGIVVLSVLIGAPLGVVYAMTQNAVRGNAVIRGMSFGVILLGVFGPLFFYGNPLEFGAPGEHLARVSLFAVLFVIFGTAAGIALAPARRLARSLPSVPRALLAVAALGGGGLLVLGTIGLAAETSRTYGEATFRLLLPWLILTVIFAIAIRPHTASAGAFRSQLFRLGATRQPQHEGDSGRDQDEAVDAVEHTSVPRQQRS